MNSSPKSPFSLIDIPPGKINQELFTRLVRRRRKELLAEFDLHNLPALTINQESWLKSEVIQALDSFAEAENSYLFTIIQQGWADFWSGEAPIPPDLFQLDSLTLQDADQIRHSLGQLIVPKIRKALPDDQPEYVLSLLALSEQLTPDKRAPVDQAVRHFLSEESATWTTRIMMPQISFRKSEIRKWFPMNHEQLICQLPSRFNRSSVFLARQRLRVCDYVAGKLSRRQRKMLIPVHRSNPAWDQEFREKWDNYEQSVLSIPREKRSNTELSPLAAIGIGVSVFASLFITGILLDNKPRPVNPFTSPLVWDSFYYEPSYDWDFIDTSTLTSLPNKDSFFSGLTPLPSLPEITPIEWPEPFDSGALERMVQLQRLIDSFRYIRDSIASDSSPDTTNSGTDSIQEDSIQLHSSAPAPDSTSQSTP